MVDQLILSEMQNTFASDNYSGVHPDIMDALNRANHGHAGSYGSDEYTARAVQKFKEHFGDHVEVFFCIQRNRRKCSELKCAYSIISFCHLF